MFSPHCLPHILVSEPPTTKFPRQRSFHCQLSCLSCFSCFCWFFSLSTAHSRFQSVDRRVSSPTRLPLSTFLLVIFFLLLLVSPHCRLHVLVSKVLITKFLRQRGFHCQLSLTGPDFLTVGAAPQLTCHSRFQTVNSRVSSPMWLPLSILLFKFVPNRRHLFAANLFLCDLSN